ncbi:hypothetical protein L208DRAFT_1310092 [Tricholoma matsutake]|nr:hypothetical protein L208DRAFT_1310092 [Tricholoma matsutake 945]
MTKIVNSLSAQLEMGSPMACMYLLGNPDHYTNFDFVPFYWQSFVTEARNFSPVHDYLYCPARFHAMCLYDWISTCQQEKLPSRIKQKSSAEPVAGDVDEQCNSLLEDIESCIDNNTTTQMPKKKLLPFLSEHPLAETHGVCYLKMARIPNLIGNTIPCHYQRDCEHYCSTMLTLFKPWRSGLDLMHASDSWDESF